MRNIISDGQIDIKFANHLTIDGNNEIKLLGIDFCKDVIIKSINENTNLSIFKSTLNEFPSDGNLTLDRFRLSNCEVNCPLPDKLTIKSDFILFKVSPINFPKNIKIGGELYLSNVMIDELPDNLEIFGNLYLSKVNIDKLPSGLIIHGNLTIIYCENLTEIPHDTIIGGKIDISSNHDMNINCTIASKLDANCKLNLNLDGDNNFDFEEYKYGKHTYYTVKRKTDSLSEVVLETNDGRIFKLNCDKKEGEDNLIEVK